jgi:hypothetical protein
VDARKKLPAKLIFSYLIGALPCFVYIMWPNFGGHADVPFSAFPESLVLVPIAPLAAAYLITLDPKVSLIGLSIFLASAFLVFKVVNRLFPELSND